MVTSVAGSGAGRVLGRYLLFDAIARGGMATVHFARLSGPVGFSRTVAIKRLHPHLATDPEFVTMFLDEARLAARIRHPNVVPTLDVVAANGEVFIVMEYVQGESLARLARTVRTRNERIPIRYALAAVAGALHGLHAAHEVTDESGQPLGIVHRDVSPQNILVGTDGVSRVLDFGVAKAAGRMQETGDSGSLKGKIAYMAPEHIAGSGVTRRTDIYAAAVVLWELLVGERLFDGESDAQRAAKILGAMERNAIPPPSRYNPLVEPALDGIVMRGLAWPPEARWSTAKEMAVAIERNGGLVPASELGDWVTSLAGPALAERAERLNAIEASTKNGRSSTTGPALIEAVEEGDRTVLAEPPPFSGGGATEVGTMSMGRPAPAAPSLASTLDAPRTSSGWRVAGIAAIVLAASVAFVVAWRSLRPSEPARTADAPPSTSAAAGVLGDVETTAPAPSASAITAASVAVTMEVGPTASAAASSAPPASAAPTTTKTSTSRGGGRTGGAAKPKDDCDPPYTIDAENHKIYKRHCIK